MLYQMGLNFGKRSHILHFSVFCLLSFAHCRDHVFLLQDPKDFKTYSKSNSQVGWNWRNNGSSTYEKASERSFVFFKCHSCLPCVVDSVCRSLSSCDFQGGKPFPTSLDCVRCVCQNVFYAESSHVFCFLA